MDKKQFCPECGNSCPVKDLYCATCGGRLALMVREEAASAVDLSPYLTEGDSRQKADTKELPVTEISESAFSYPKAAVTKRIFAYSIDLIIAVLPLLRGISLLNRNS